MSDSTDEIIRKVNEIKPSVKYRSEISIDKLHKKYKELCVCRRIDGRVEDVIESVGEEKILIDKAVGTPADYSVNLIGGVFTDEHIGLHSSDNYCNGSWKNHHECNIEGKQIDEKEPCFPIYYSIEDFMNYPAEQEKTFRKKKDFEKWVAGLKEDAIKKFGIDIYVKDKKYSAVCGKCAKHRPTNMNYWHVTLDFYSVENPDREITSEDREDSHKRIVKHFKHDFLMKRFSLENPSDYKIAPRYYKMYWIEYVASQIKKKFKFKS